MRYSKKAKFLQEHGWETLWSDNNWIKTEWWDTIGDIDRAGITTDDAYRLEKNKEREKEEDDALKKLPFNEMWEKIYGK
jgi:hypothetical protein